MRELVTAVSAARLFQRKIHMDVGNNLSKPQFYFVICIFFKCSKVILVQRFQKPKYNSRIKNKTFCI